MIHPAHTNPWVLTVLFIRFLAFVSSNVGDQLGSGAMLVMALAHARKSGDITLISKYQDLLYKWSDFLVTNSLQLNGSYVESPSPRPWMKLSVFSSMTADGLVGATSNLALKGIMGIYAMGEIVKLLESKPKRATYYLVSSFPSLFW